MSDHGQELFSQDLEDFADSPGAVESGPSDEPSPGSSGPPQAAPTRSRNGTSNVNGTNGTTGNGTKSFDFGEMVEQFGKIRSRLVEIAGDQRGRAEYYEILKDFGCSHANEFKSAAEARRAYKVLAATLEQWEAEPPPAAEEPGPDSGSLFDDEPQDEGEPVDDGSEEGARIDQ